MFWGLIMEPNKRYTQAVEKSFHVSMASLDAVTADNGIVQVMLCYDDRNYLLCSLKKDLAWQVPLDLNFQEGTKIAFTSNGRGHVHLTGYLIPEEEDDLDLDELEEEDDDEDEEVPQLVGNQIKRKAKDSPKDSKKVKRLKAVANEEESSDDDEDEAEKDEEEDEDSLEAGVEVDDSDQDDDDDDEDDDDEEEEEEDDDSEDEEEEETQVKPQQKKNKQKEQQQQKNKVNAKQDKQKMVNGKDAKQEQTKQQTKKNKNEQQQQQQQQQNNAQQVQKKRVIEGGVLIEDVKVGTGTPAKSGKFISVYYVGRLKNGKKFDSTLGGEGFKFRLGKGEVIKGWDVGIAGMKVGGKRKITIPPPFAYGAKGSPPTIPGNSTLVFEVELKNVH